MEDDNLYSKFSKNAIKRSKYFEYDLMINKIEKFITE